MKPLLPPVAAALAAALLSLPAAHAADPFTTSLTPGFTFQEYSGSAAVGVGAVDTASTLFFIDEKSVGAFKSWLVFFDPPREQTVAATVQFDAPIAAVYATRGSIDSTTPTYGAAGINYGSWLFGGIEGADTISFTAGSNTLSLRWLAIDPGDHIRVITSAVPEPETYALFAAGLLAMGYLGRRRSARRG